MNRTLVAIDGRRIVCDVARTAAEKSIGLQKHGGLGDNEGMLFPFEPPQQVLFHMGDVEFPIDMIFSYRGRVTHVQPGIRPGTKGRWGAFCDSVIEVRGGWCAGYDVRVGSSVKIGPFARSAAPTYDLLRSITNAEAEKPVRKPTDREIDETLRAVESSKKMTPIREIAAKVYAIYMQNNPDSMDRDDLSPIELDRIVQSWDGRNIWLTELRDLAEQGLLPGYADNADDYKRRFAWAVAEWLRNLVAIAHRWWEDMDLRKAAQMHSQPDVREDTKQPGAVRHLRPEDAWNTHEIPADTVGVSDSAPRKTWDQSIGYDASVPGNELLGGTVPAIRPSASKTAGGDIHPGDRVRAIEKADGLQDDEEGVCLEVQNDMVWITFDGEPVPRWVRKDLLSQDQEKDQILQEIDQEKQEQQQQDGQGGLAGLMGAM